MVITTGAQVGYETDAPAGTGAAGERLIGIGEVPEPDVIVVERSALGALYGAYAAAEPFPLRVVPAELVG